jgi:elongation factor P
MRVGSELRSRMTLRLEGALYRVIAADYHGGQGKMGGVMHVKLRSLETGKERERSFRADEPVEEVQPEKRPMQYVYADGPLSYFMDPETFEQLGIETERLGRAAPWLKEETTVPVEFVEGRPMGVDFPDVVEVRVAETAEPVRSHQGTDNVWKEAALENGLKVLVPPFIAAGERIRVSVYTGRYLERAKAKGR